MRAEAYQGYRCRDWIMELTTTENYLEHIIAAAHKMGALHVYPAA